MGGADGVDVKLLAQQNVPLDLLRGHGIAVCGARVMVVHAVEFDFSAVYKEHIALYLHGLEANALLHAGGRRFVIDVIKRRLLRVPLGDGQGLEDGGGFSVQCPDGFRLLYPEALDGEGHVRIRVCLRCHGEAVGIPLFFRPGVDVPEVCGLLDAQKHVPEDAVIAEHILALKIRARAPAADHRQKLVLAFSELPRQIELRGVMRALGVAGKFPVQVKIEAACHAQKGDDVALFRAFDGDPFSVHAHEVVFLARVLSPQGELLVRTEPGEYPPDLFRGGDHGGLIGKLIPDIHVEGPVIAPELPAGRHVDRIERHRVRIQHLRQLRRAGVEPEIPVPVKA